MQKILTLRKPQFAILPIALILAALLCLATLMLLRNKTASSQTFENEIEIVAEKKVAELPSVTMASSIKSAAQSGVSQLLGGEWTLAKLAKAGEVACGASGDQIFVATSGNRKAFIKTFEYPAAYYKETLSLEIFGGLGLQTIHTPKVYGSMRAMVNEKEYYVLVEEHLKGHTLYDHLIALLADHTHKEHKEHLKTLAKSYFLLGRGMAELHLAGAYERELHPRMEQMLVSKVENGSALLAKNTKIDEKRLKDYFQKIHAVEGVKPFVHGYMHNDPNPGNFFFAKGVDGVYMVDLQDGAISIEDGKPIGLPARDYALVMEHIDLCYRMGGLTSTEYKHLSGEFKRGYVEMGGAVPDAKQFEYLQWVNVMGYIEWYLMNKNHFPRAMSHVLERVYEQHHAWIVKILKDQETEA